ncbi:hypothetical protein CVT26_014809 [Gymnopilus dilepis]|uniref:F-box domain-containing protein n=1 Tax=Gymnopilus dilepis TaxID=231916 RepID=A0A409W9S5_9AGAR|nr:hypothetical protein CVT26_014809 [Gymnopilus dilepis]
MLRFLNPSWGSSSRYGGAKKSSDDQSKLGYANATSAPILPPELIDPIIDEVARSQDIQSLRACCLAHSTFVFRSQSHLFKTVDLDKWSPREKYHRRFHNLLLTSPHLGAHVRDFRLGDDSEDDYGRDASPWITTSTTLAHTLTLLCRLESISISFNSELTDWHAIPSPTRCAITRIFSLQTLRAVSLDFISSFPPQLLVTLTRLPCLALSNVDVDESAPFYVDRPISTFSENPGLQSLVVKGTSPRTVQVIAYSLGATHSSTLRKLSVGPTFEAGFCEAVCDLLKSKAGGSISSFEWMPPAHLVIPSAPLDITPLTRLRCLKLLINFHNSHKGPFAQAICFLSQLASEYNQVQRISFECHFLQLPCRFNTGGILRRESSTSSTKPASGFDVDTWHYLDRVLSHPAFKELKTVKFELAPSSSVDIDHFRAEMAFKDLGLFTALREKGINVVVQVQSATKLGL